MSKKHIYSIRRYLLTSVLWALLVVACVTAISIYFKSKDELDELYNENLRQVASVIILQYKTAGQSSTIEPYDYSVNIGNRITREEQLFIRITNKDGKTIYMSHPDIQLQQPTHEGYSSHIFKNKRWRIYMLRGSGLSVEVAQSVPLRNIAIRQVVFSLIIPQMAFIPLLGLFMWIIVGRSLQPLENLSQLIQRQDIGKLQPIALQSTPAEVMPLILALNTLLEEFGAMIMTLRHFTSDAAHELRTPLTALKLQLALVERASDNDQRLMAIDQLKNGIENSIALVQQLLILARSEPHALSVDFVQVDLNELVKTAISRFLPFALQKNIDLGTRQQSSATVYGDPAALAILLNNLIDNAIRYTPEQGQVDVNVYSYDRHVDLEVIDNGPGIQSEEENRLFDRFYRGQNSSQQSGTGLGLAIVKEIAKQHDAIIIINDESRYMPGLQLIIRFNIEGV